MIEQLLASLPAVALYAARVGGVVVSTPGLDLGQTPSQVKVMLVLALALMLFGALGASDAILDLDPVFLVAMVPLEFAIGVAMGFATRLIFAAVELAGEFVSFQMGFAAAAVFDPSTGASISPPTRLLFVVAILIFFAIDGHHQVILALAGSYSYVPVGAASVGSINPEAFMLLVWGLFETAARLAFPLIFVMLIINAVLGALVRFVPQVNVFMIGFILTMGLGLVAMADLMPSFVSAIVAMLAGVGEVLPGLFR